nr:MAG TPA: hypothetical protein [Caudoviricetes sp.]
MMRFAGKNSFFQLRARDFSFYMNAYIRYEILYHRNMVLIQIRVHLYKMAAIYPLKSFLQCFLF